MTTFSTHMGAHQPQISIWGRRGGTHLLRVDGIHNGRLLCGFVDEQVHIVIREGREQFDGHVTELFGGATGVMLGHACQRRIVNTG